MKQEIPCSRSGLKIEPWMKGGVQFREKRGFVRGFFFVNYKGRRIGTKD